MKVITDARNMRIIKYITNGQLIEIMLIKGDNSDRNDTKCYFHVLYISYMFRGRYGRLAVKINMSPS